jgi:hypothetical protein
MCDAWHCPSCAVRKAAWLRDNIASAIPRYGLESFTTHTLRTTSCSAEESFSYISRAFNIFRTDAKRDIGAFSYVKVTEPTKRGYAHIHMLSSLSIDPGELSRRWRNATDTSWVVDVQSTYSQGAANYLAKYCAKEATRRRQILGKSSRWAHMYSKSRDIHFSELRSSSEKQWMLYRSPWKQAREELGALAGVVSEKTEGVPAMTLEGDLTAKIPLAARQSRCTEQGSDQVSA